MELIQVTIPEAELSALQRDLSPDEFKRAQYNIIKRVTSSVAAAMKKKIKEAADVPMAVIQNGVRVRMQSGEIPVGVITVSGRRIPLDLLHPKVSKRGGVSYDYAGKHIVLRHAFLAGMSSGHVGIFERARHVPPGGGEATGRGRSAKDIKAARRRHLTNDPDGSKEAARQQRTHSPSKLTPEGIAGRLAIFEETAPSLPGILDLPKIQAELQVDIGRLLDREIASARNRFLVTV
jgi:hypothetical protein